jgi:hypothetical protein
MCGADASISVAQYLAWLVRAGPNSAHRATVATAIACWDAAKATEWIGETLPNSQARRDLMNVILELSDLEAQALNAVFPQSPSLDPPVTITEDEGWTRWYVPERRSPSFYWSSYRRYLVEKKVWDAKSVAGLDVASSEVLERLCDPLAKSMRPTKGLVVGYVQSGKTANFTGVIAKAIDAGYRLVIVLAGMQNTLRAQTQRRIDKELLGKEFVEQDYGCDSDWREFVSHDGLPSNQGACDWVRLTTKSQDFRDVAKGLRHHGLMFDVADKSEPFRSASARLAVVKKNEKALRDFITALVGAAQYVPLGEIPTLIIDDESDQASINAAAPRAGQVKERKTINRLIVRLLGELKNAQYIGYTATPFANVFIDPDDAVDLFPADFILSLPKPLGYMGVREFTDEEFEATDDRSNRWAHVREVRGRDDDEGNLDVAIDAFVLAGAIKVYREKVLGNRFKHHTMLVHSSPLQMVHEDDARRVRELFLGSNYLGVSGGDRLKRLWESDFAVRCAKRAGSDPVPACWGDIAECVPEAYGRITSADDPVIVLNGGDAEAAPDFDSESIWRIIVGGAKLSRGYTVEGLTVSYYRRTATATDTLLQMGRWFGFRDHYRDLVRLYIGVAEQAGKEGATLNLYEAFEAACRDEEEFRAQLSRYSSLVPEERITPKQVPPLVPAHLLPPTARNKMFNAVLQFVNFGGRTVERTSVATDSSGRTKNIHLLTEMLGGMSLDRPSIELAVDGNRIAFDACAGVFGNAHVVDFLTQFRWEGPAPRDWPLVTGFARGEHGDPEFNSWLIVAPQLKTCLDGELEIGCNRLSVKRRGRTGARFAVLSEPAHVLFAKWATGLVAGDPLNAETAALVAEHRAVMLLYPVIPTESLPGASPCVGYSLYFPKNALLRKHVFSVHDSARPSDIVVAST